MSDDDVVAVLEAPLPLRFEREHFELLALALEGLRAQLRLRAAQMSHGRAQQDAARVVGMLDQVERRLAALREEMLDGR